MAMAIVNLLEEAADEKSGFAGSHGIIDPILKTGTPGRTIISVFKNSTRRILVFHYIYKIKKQVG
jgi:hypothetical protein